VLGLKWRWSDVPQDGNSGAQGCTLPAAALAELRVLAGQGDVSGLQIALQQWRTRLPSHQAIFDQLSAFTADYNLDRVEEFLAKARPAP